MGDKAWKAVERRVASLYGCERISLSGGNNHQAGTRSDTTHPRLFVEVKHGKRFLGLWKLWVAYRALARVEGRVPVLVLHPLGARDSLVLLSLERHVLLEGLVDAVNRGDAGEAAGLADALVKEGE